jgi:ubiquinone/menaquinone biosynthesis C-methylase UbiE
MSESRPLGEKLFWEVHSNLPREAPGDAESTLRAIDMLKDLPSVPAILDIGCGPGAQTVTLARHSAARITAVDTHQPFLDDLARRATKAGVSDRVKRVNVSMFELVFDETFDVIWSEGAVYIIGFEEGLRKWRPLLKPGGYAAVTELSWLKSEPPADALAFWREAYPGMATVEENLLRLRRAGYREVGHFTLPDSAWWDSYYRPMEARIVQLREKYRDNPEAQRLLDAEYAEIDLFRKYSAWYGYVFYVMRSADFTSDGAEKRI